jgi:hypothetical protein
LICLSLAPSTRLFELLGIANVKIGYVKAGAASLATKIELPLVAYFAFKWLPRAPRLAFSVLGLQALALIAALSPEYFLNL